MGQYRKKPVIINAWKAKELHRAWKWDVKLLPVEIAHVYQDAGWIFASDHIIIPTLKGNHRANLDDMVIMGVKGEFYPCKPDIFAATYDEVSPI